MEHLAEVAMNHSHERDQQRMSRSLRTWRMRVFQLRGPEMQAHRFYERSQRLKLRVVFRIWRVKASLRNVAPNTPSVFFNTPDQAHTAPVIPSRSTRRLMWRSLNSQ
jgi:Sfi1 spindle body protein